MRTDITLERSRPCLSSMKYYVRPQCSAISTKKPYFGEPKNDFRVREGTKGSQYPMSGENVEVPGMPSTPRRGRTARLQLSHERQPNQRRHST